MTAEVAVMNKSAVALAADSAMSVGNPRKTYPTNKLFALSRHRPVGVMIYNNAEFMGVPWETLVKMHRQNIGHRGMATVSEYADSLLDFISNDAICTERQKVANLRRIANGFFGRFANLQASGGGSSSPQSSIEEIVEGHMRAMRESETAPSLEDLDVDGLLREHEVVINASIDDCFAGLDIGDSVRQSLHRSLAAEIKSVRLSEGFSGLVFAGFGEEEAFPSLIEVVTDGAVGDFVKVHTKKRFDVNRDNRRVAVMAFAQAEMVGRFMEGVDTQYLTYLYQSLERVFFTAVREMLESGAADEQLRGEQMSQLQRIAETHLGGFRQAADQFRQEQFVSPVLDIVKDLPKEELANMAEALVSLTSLKRRVSVEEESVGGPVDVAVVSKGDGFIWIKRKHYFDPLLNRDYFVRQSPVHPTAPRGEYGL